MVTEQLIKFVEGKLSLEEIKILEQQFIENPDLLEVVGGLNRIKQLLSPTQNLHNYLEIKKNQIKHKIINDIKNQLEDKERIEQCM